MWNKEQLAKICFMNFDLGNFEQGLPVLLDILEDPQRIPSLYTLSEEEKGELLLRTLSYNTFEDKVTLENFRIGLSRINKNYQNIHVDEQNKNKMGVHTFFKDLDLSSKTFRKSFLHVSVDYGPLAYSLDFKVDEKKNGKFFYSVSAQKIKPNFSEIMDGCLGPNIYEPEIF